TLPCEDVAGNLHATFSPDGSTLAWMGKRHQIHLADVATGKVRLSLQGHSGNVTYLAFSPDCRPLASCSGDATGRTGNVERYGVFGESGSPGIGGQRGGGSFGLKGRFFQPRPLAWAGRNGPSGRPPNHGALRNSPDTPSCCLKRDTVGS